MNTIQAVFEGYVEKTMFFDSIESAIAYCKKLGSVKVNHLVVDENFDDEISVHIGNTANIEIAVPHLRLLFVVPPTIYVYFSLDKVS